MDNIICPHCDEEILKDSKSCEYCCEEIIVSSIDSNNFNHEKESKFCIHCGKKVYVIAKWCNYCGKKLEDDLNMANILEGQKNSLNQSNDYHNNNLNQSGEFEKYIIRLQSNLPNPELIDLHFFKEVNFYKVSDMFAYVKYIPNITKDAADRFIKDSTKRTGKNSGLSGSFVPPISAHIIVSTNLTDEIIRFILNSKEIKMGLTKSIILMNAVYDLSNYTLHYKNRTELIGSMRNSSANRFIEKFNV